jgi:hypothetical protein
MIRVTIGPVIYASYSLMRYDYAHMNDNIERRNKNSKNPSQRGDNNRNKRTIASSDIKNRMEQAIIEPNIDGVNQLGLMNKRNGIYY